jgi:glycine C-acetyltransferase
MYINYQKHLVKIIDEIKDNGLYKNERIIVSPQGAEIELNTGQKVLNFCANNYLGLSNDPSLIEAAKASRDVFREVYLWHH